MGSLCFFNSIVSQDLVGGERNIHRHLGDIHRPFFRHPFVVVYVVRANQITAYSKVIGMEHGRGQKIEITGKKATNDN